MRTGIPFRTDMRVGFMKHVNLSEWRADCCGEMDEFLLCCAVVILRRGEAEREEDVMRMRGLRGDSEVV